ncbi:GGDEF domain-containing protein [Shewanella gaetbuli]|uniref:diguanylate cyclase n=1 Tax=Shewanella gaetbuli TaxID=220752 RepID=A0A9X1ZIF2_9GAMM|nr:GGDEF domain-containing protein [Shewanella gaetbuli]MCL1142313.1 GGDEF domain-containing protein [Shewanella gaetbuli]
MPESSEPAFTQLKSIKTHSLPSFSQQMRIEVDSYLVQSCRWLTMLSCLLIVVFLAFRVLNQQGLSVLQVTMVVTPLLALMGISTYLALNYPQFKRRFYTVTYMVCLAICWSGWVSLGIVNSPELLSSYESLVNILGLAFVIALFPLRSWCLIVVLGFVVFISFWRIYLLPADFALISTTKLICFFIVIVTGQIVANGWFIRAVKKDAENKRLLQKLAHQAQTDALTELANRGCFDNTLTTEIANSQRTQKPLCIILLDVDFFKKLNDSLGHQKGDKCLIEIAKMLAGVANRPRDLCARYGGEEFILLLPETDLAGAIIVAEKIKKRLSELAIPHPDSNVSQFVTVSQGIAQFKSGMTEDELCHVADENLYKVKQSTRNHFAFNES